MSNADKDVRRQGLCICEVSKVNHICVSLKVCSLIPRFPCRLQYSKAVASFPGSHVACNTVKQLPHSQASPIQNLNMHVCPELEYVCAGRACMISFLTYTWKYDITGIRSEFLEWKGKLVCIVQPITWCV